MANATWKHEEKFSPNCEGPFRVKEVVSKDAYRLEHLSSVPISATWNASHIKFYYR